ncbi:hypothetical protein C2W64_00892 [Brevibacillus laterosporus]|nr:hypothetical protein C2W64_00892 [Brevibacillus laterosporus]
MGFLFRFHLASSNAFLHKKLLPVRILPTSATIGESAIKR